MPARLVRNPAEGGTGYLRDVRRSALRAAMGARRGLSTAINPAL